MKLRPVHMLLSHLVVAVFYRELRQLMSLSVESQRQAAYDEFSFLPNQVAPPSKPVATSVSACLLVMDENFRLQEWLAYAYFTLRLNYVVVTVDPRSKYKPTEKLDIFRKELNMTIIEWEDEDFVDWVPFGPKAPGRMVRKRHRRRQARFYEACMKHLYLQNKTWTALYDTDEYVVFSKYSRNYGTFRSPASMSKPGSVLDFINHAQASSSKDPLLKTDCYMIPRITHGAKEISPEELRVSIPRNATVQPFQLDTLRWRFHNLESEAKENGPAKVIIDVSVLKRYFPLEVTSPHRPVHALCGPSALYKDIADSPFRINHYLGSWEAYSFREDSRKGAERSREGWQFQANHSNEERSDQAATWLKGFYKEVGFETANRVLDAAGIPISYVAKDDPGWAFRGEAALTAPGE